MSQPHYKDGKLTRTGMVSVISRGASVIYKGRVVTSEAELPTPAELAEGDPEAAQSVLADIESQQKLLAEQQKRLRDSIRKDGKSEPTAPSLIK